MTNQRRVNSGKQCFIHQTIFIALVGLLLLGSLAAPAANAGEDGLMMLSVAAAPKVAGLKQVQAKVLINAPPRAVWQTLTNYPNLKKVIPGYEKSQVLQNKGNNKLLDIAMKVAAFLPTYRYQVQVQEHEADYSLSLNRVSGDFKSFEATYRLVPQGNGTRTLLLYTLNIDPGTNIPGSNGILRANTEKSLKALERHVEQEARKSEIGQG